MRSFFYCWLLSFLLGLGITDNAIAQKKTREVGEEIPTWAVKKKKRNAAIKARPKELPVRYIIITKTEGVLYGNPCALQETQKMGFQYLLLRKGQPGYENMWEKLDNNLDVKVGLVFRKSPFWKLILKKRIERCRRDTGDFVGSAEEVKGEPRSAASQVLPFDT